MMTDKQLRKLKRVELLDMLIEQGKLVEAQNKEIAELKSQIEDLKKEAQDFRFSIEKSGSIAEASVKVSGVFEAAQRAALIYLDNLREKSGVPTTAEEALKEAMQREDSGDVKAAGAAEAAASPARQGSDEADSKTETQES